MDSMYYYILEYIIVHSYIPGYLVCYTLINTHKNIIKCNLFVSQKLNNKFLKLTLLVISHYLLGRLASTIVIYIFMF